MITHKRSLYRTVVFSFAFLALLLFSSSSVANASPVFDRSNFNLTSMCKPTVDQGSMRIRNNSGVPQAYVLSLVGSAVTFNGIAPVGDSLVTVQWNLSSDTWILNIAGHSFTKAVGNNPICVPTHEAPEFGIITSTIALLASGGSIFFLRKGK